MLNALRRRLFNAVKRRGRSFVDNRPWALMLVTSTLLRSAQRRGASVKLKKGRPPRVKSLFQIGLQTKLEADVVNRAQQLAEDIRRTLDQGREIRPELEGQLVKASQTLGSIGRFEPAIECLRAAARIPPAHSQRAIDYCRTLGVFLFMLGRMREAMPWFHQAGNARRVLLAHSGVPQKFRILGTSWFPAIGHIAMLAFLVQRQKLGWEAEDVVYVGNVDLTQRLGKVLASEFTRHGINLAWPQQVHDVYREMRLQEDLEWGFLTNDERSALVQEFWELDFPDTGALFYAHAAAKIQNQWEAEQRAPLLQLTDAQKAAIPALLDQLGIPRSAWFVCLHVREPGFHARWNQIYRSARDADVGTYEEAITEITRRGGWVIRVGDASMAPLPPMAQTVDYARSRFKSQLADILLCAGCRFFLGTNSGLSIIPGIYGVPCLLTNWVPLGLPNWFGRDLVVPKLIRDETNDRFFTAAEIYDNSIGYTQNSEHLPAGVAFVDNTPGELREATVQMLEELEDPQTPLRDLALEQAYFQLAESLGSYRGSRMSSTFARRHAASLGVPVQVSGPAADAVVVAPDRPGAEPLLTY